MVTTAIDRVDAQYFAQDGEKSAEREPGVVAQSFRKGRTALIIGVSVIALSLGACAERPKTAVGAAGGAAGGGLLAAALGASPVGIAAGVILGGLAGGAIGNALDQADLDRAARAQQQALETARTNQTINWTNPDSGNSGTYTPKRTYESNGQPCREYQQTVTVGGQTESAFGTACRQPDGSWKIVS